MKTGLVAIILCSAVNLYANGLKFRPETVDDAIAIGYGVATADVDGDGKTDILLADKRQFVWYRNPTWEKFILAENLTRRDNVCIAAQDINGDGKCEIAVGGDWDPNDREHSGAVFYLVAPEDPTQKWEPIKLPAEPTVHRMRWLPFSGSQTGWALVVAPLHGRGNNPSASPKILAYSVPRNVRDQWPRVDLLEGSGEPFQRTHNIDLKKPDELLIANAKGVYTVRHDGNALEGQIVAPSERGAGEVRWAERAGFIATIEPMHGTELVVYQGGQRLVLSDRLVEGHALACGDLVGGGGEQIVVGWRGESGGVRVFSRSNEAMINWQETVIDDGGMACEDLCLADLNADGKLDIIASGRATRNVKIYWNETRSNTPSAATLPSR